MSLEITGKLIQKLPEVGGTSKSGNAWKKQEFVIETDDQYPKKICANLWGDNADVLNNFQIGENVKMSFNIESREFNGRWYTDVRAWKLEKVNNNSDLQVPPTQPTPPAVDPFTPDAMPSMESNDPNDLPF